MIIMAVSSEEYLKEKKILKLTTKLLNDTLSDLKKEVRNDFEDLKEFKKLMWDGSNSFDDAEIIQTRLATSSEEEKNSQKERYYKRLRQIEKKPYFASLVFEDEEDNEIFNIYISLTYLKDKHLNNILYDWRSPICSLFYDYETGPCEYRTPGGKVVGTLKRKRQYKIEENMLQGVFDNSLNIDDEVLQDILSTESSEKMKNVVNTIQQEQNKVIRNILDHNLIVQGIAGSGKTTVALHRIAFLLYRLEYLNSNNILIFSPNDIFTEYISEVLPSLGESNTLQTTFNDYLANFITEYKEVESFSDFIARYYSYSEPNPDLIRYKQSDEIINDLDKFLAEYIKNAKCISDFVEGDINKVTKEEINEMIHYKYNVMPLFERLDEISNRLSSNFYDGKLKKAATFKKLINKNINFKEDYKEIYVSFLKSNYCKIKQSDESIKRLLKQDAINYEDALILAYIKGTLKSFPYENTIKQVVIDEAQDYNKLQYIIINKIFKKADFTILGDINQNINPYYKYNSLEELSSIFKEDSRYLELLKTYRSSPEIIDYTNKILNLKHVNAIRRATNKKVIIRKNIEDLKESLLSDMNYFTNEYQSCAIITKDMTEAEKLFKLVKDDYEISIIDETTKNFHKDLVIIPAYIAKGLEFDSVLVYNNRENSYKKNERNLLYVACTRAQHELCIYN